MPNAIFFMRAIALVKIDFEIYVRAGARALDWNTVQWISLHISIVFCTQNIHGTTGNL